MSLASKIKSVSTPSPTASVAVIATLAAGAATALWARSRARRAERDNPPTGRFLEIDGVRLHFVERGTGHGGDESRPPVVLLHGNAVSLQDFEASGLIDALAQNHRVIAFDRPGLGHSNRPGDRVWTPAEQAALLDKALKRLGIPRAIVVGHSVATVIALAWALDHPESVAALVLLSGYYFLTPRIDSILLAPLAMPILGNVLCHTAGALSSRVAIGGAVKAMFSPKPVPDDFFPTLSREMMLRPSQLKADVEDGLLMLAAARSNAERYAELRMPVAIIAGANDKIVDTDAHSVRLHEQIEQSELMVQPGVGHMVHYAAKARVVAAIDWAATESNNPTTDTAAAAWTVEAA